MEPARWLVGKEGCWKGVYVTETNAVVRFGHHVFPEREAAMMQFILQKCPEIPVPVVYDHWTEDQGTGYIAMAYMPGKNLDEIWTELSTGEKETVMKEYKAILHRLRSVDPSPDMPVQIGAINGGPVVDHRTGDRRTGGPFSTEAELNSWLLSLLHPESQEWFLDFHLETIKAGMKDDHKWRLSHGDMGPHNVLVENGHITAVIDWELSGWYPEYWDYVKMMQYLPSGTWDFQAYARRLWTVDGQDVFYDMEYMVDQMLDAWIEHGERVVKRPR